MIMYGADTDAAMIINAARRFPMMSEYQLVVVREAQLVRDIELLTNYVKNPLKSTVLVVNYKYKNLDRRKSLAAATEKTGVLFEAKKIPDYKMPGLSFRLCSSVPSGSIQRPLKCSQTSLETI